MKLTLRYFALLREERGLEEEQVDTTASTPATLYDELRTRHDFTLPRERMMVVVNDAYTGWDQALHDGDTVVFIPPVAGG
jgi:molybdopterin converting factor small subunit